MLQRCRVWFVLAALSLVPIAFTKTARGQSLERTLAVSADSFSHQRVPLLVIDPEHTNPVKGVPATRPGDTLARIAARYSRKIVALDSLTVLAPVEMARLAPPPFPPRGKTGRDMGETLAQFLDLLEPSQWAALTGPDGLAFSDLTQVQQNAFAQVAPAPLATQDLSNEKTHSLTASERAAARLRLSRDTFMTMPGTDMQGKQMTYGFASLGTTAPRVAGDPPVYIQVGDSEEEAPKDDRPASPPAYRTWVPNRAKPGDLDLRETSSAAAVLSKPVLVSGASTLGDLVKRASAVSGWELYADQRVARLPVRVYPPGRQMGDSAPLNARLGDVLRALCWAVTGTFRRVGPAGGEVAYVLTDDREGIGSRLARIQEWDRLERFLSEQSGEKAVSHMRDKKLGGTVSYAPDDPYALPAPLVRSLTDSLMGRERPDGNNVKFGELPRALQERVRQDQKEFAESKDGPVTLNTEKVALQPTLALSLILPNGGGRVELNTLPPGDFLTDILAPSRETPGEVAGQTVSELPALPPEKRLHLSETRKPFVLRMVVMTPGDATAAVHLARRFGFKGLWLDTTGDETGRQALAVAVAEAKPAGRFPVLPVTAVVSLLKTPAPGLAGDDSNLDRNILGESSGVLARRRSGDPDTAEFGFSKGAIANLLGPPLEWLRFDLPAQSEAHIRRIAGIAQIPGLAGLALADSATPGYVPLSLNDTDDWFVGLGDSGDFGYTPEMRLAFLRSDGYDPIDLCAGGTDFGSSSADLPFFPNPPLMRGRIPDYYSENHISYAALPVIRWEEARHKRLLEFCASLYKRLHASNPSLPLLMAEQSGSALDGIAYWGSWDVVAKPPSGRKQSARDGAITSVDPHTTSRYVLRPMPFPADLNHKEWARNLILFRAGGVLDKLPTGLNEDATLFDLHAMKAAEAQSFVEGTLAPAR